MSPDPSQPTPITPQFEVEVIRDMRIPTAESGVTLSADVFLPAGAGPVPALVMATPYRKDASVGIEQEPHFRWFAARGYAGLLFDFRGLGSSDGEMRPAFDPSEADDGVAAIEWVADRPWCDGKVGMWGLSYGSIMSMRTASRRPGPLKAIIPVMGTDDPERDILNPCGTRGGQTPIPLWSTHNLSNQLLPPVHAFHDAVQQRRWRKRLEDEPWLLQLFRHQPGDPIWRDCVIDVPAIEVPSYCVAGWWDIFRDAQIRAFEQMQGPKKLLAGPWMHTMPQTSPFERIEFLSLALRWWDHWLRDVDDGLMDEAPVTLYVQGSAPGWRSYESWPPADGELALDTGSDTELSTGAVGRKRTQVIAEYHSDPTIGAQSGLWALAGQMFGLPHDQHEDDCRSVAATSTPLERDLLIVGRPEVDVHLASEAQPDRLAVRLCDVDPAGRSTLITSGVVVHSGQVLLDPTAHRVCAGHRLRVAISDSEFPRLWPLADAPAMAITGIDLRAPTASEALGKAVSMPHQEEPDPATTAIVPWAEPTWRITRDPVNDGIEVTTGNAWFDRAPGGESLLEMSQEVKAAVRREAPDAATMCSSQMQVVRLGTGEVIETTVRTRLSSVAVWAHGEVVIDGATVFSRTWD